MGKKYKSAVLHLLLALVPYSIDNVKLSFMPNKFFKELERSTNYKQSTFRTEFSRAKKRGLIVTHKNSQLPKLTKKGLYEVQPYIAKKLDKNAKLMIIFDIPEEQNYLRDRLRYLLKTWNFKQVQKSVWVTEYDYITTLKNVISDLGLSPYVQLFECARI